MTERTRRPSPAHTSKIAAAGIGLAAMFGIVGLMGIEANRKASVPSPTPTPAVTAAPAQVVVVIHPESAAPATGTASGSVAGSVTGSTVPATHGTVVASPTPIALTARPAVRPAPVAAAAAAPVAKTHGSR